MSSNATGIKIVPFDAGVIVPFIYLAVVNDFMTMQMAMHIA
jgi:hypothetical protein